MATDSIRLSGRPRVEELEGRILEATQDLLIETSYSGTTIAAVADRAHCGKSAIYRRWETKVDLIVAAVRASQVASEAPDTGSLRGDLLAAASHFTGSDGRSGRVLASMLTAIGTDPDLYEAAYRDVGQPPVRALIEVIERWIARGLVPSTVPVALVAGIVPTAAFGSVVLRKRDLDPAELLELVDFVVLPALRHPPA
ncbi:TetR/AcrR family transcriptional regulator [Leifsonia sp. NPDC058194]|uniref:TetR/AcrR family transcriptional regulator n=1 Tax=Leifsonia sp. NPDC058194 TaxID=3346374 RepID=UPI0036DE140B